VVEAVAESAGQVAVTLRNGTSSEVLVDRVLALTGAVGDNSIYRQLQVHECYATAAPINLSAALLGSAAGDGQRCRTRPGVLNSDRGGGPHLDTLRSRIGVERLYA